jgi:hypothetical protein
MVAVNALSTQDTNGLARPVVNDCHIGAFDRQAAVVPFEGVRRGQGEIPAGGLLLMTKQFGESRWMFGLSGRALIRSFKADSRVSSWALTISKFEWIFPIVSLSRV